MTTPVRAELVADTGCQIAEGPVWHPEEQCLYWTDIPAGRMYRFDPSTGQHECIFEGPLVGGIAIQANGDLLLVGKHGRIFLWRHGQVIGDIVEGIPSERGTRFNDLIIDPSGRLISGTMATRNAQGSVIRHGKLYRVDANGQPTQLLDGMVSPNGMGFSPDLRHIYVTDSWFGIQSIFRFDYNSTTGTMTNRQVFYQAPLDGSDGRPDGMTVDVEGNVWSAHWDGGAVVRLNPSGTETGRFAIPAGRVSSVTFGGPELGDLYVTTAQGADHEPGAGGIFRLRSVGQGRPEFRSCLRPRKDLQSDQQQGTTNHA